MDIWAIILAALGFILKDYLNDRKNNKRFEASDKYHKESIAALQAKDAKQEELLYKHLNSDEFKHKFKNMIFNYTADKINNSEILSKDVYKKVLTDFSENITIFSLKFFYSDRRETKDVSTEDRKLQLQNELDSIIYDFLNVLKSEIKIEKAYIVNNKTYSTTLPGWIIISNNMQQKDSPGIIALSNILVERFILNDIKEEHLKVIVIDYLGKIISKFRDNIISFNELRNYDDVIMEGM